MTDAAAFVTGLQTVNTLMTTTMVSAIPSGLRDDGWTANGELMEVMKGTRKIIVSLLSLLSLTLSDRHPKYLRPQAFIRLPANAPIAMATALLVLHRALTLIAIIMGHPIPPMIDLPPLDEARSTISQPPIPLVDMNQMHMMRRGPPTVSGDATSERD
ncbi:MAG: hypothetical protein M1820_008499 [Bogoriella megaspora]|nr:MAG: hypothetical protein M1820_008499 [Bogoriella megaspora]